MSTLIIASPYHILSFQLWVDSAVFHFVFVVVAAARGHEDIVEQLANDKRLDVQWHFTEASRKGNALAVRVLLGSRARDINVNKRDADGNAALHLAAKYGHREVCIHSCGLRHDHLNSVYWINTYHRALSLPRICCWNGWKGSISPRPSALFGSGGQSHSHSSEKRGCASFSDMHIC